MNRPAVFWGALRPKAEEYYPRYLQTYHQRPSGEQVFSLSFLSIDHQEFVLWSSLPEFWYRVTAVNSDFFNQQQGCTSRALQDPGRCEHVDMLRP